MKNQKIQKENLSGEQLMESNAAMINANTKRVRTGLELVDKTTDPLQRQRLLNEAEHEWMLGARYII